MNTDAAWEQAQNILCVRLDTIGDVLMTTPALRALKEAQPGRRLTLLTSAAGAEAARLVPELDRYIVYDAPWLKATAPRHSSLPEYTMAEALRRDGYDAAVIFTVYSQNPLPSAMLCYLADIPLRLAHCHENPYQLLTHWVPDPEPARQIRHEVRRQLDLVATVGSRTLNEHLSLRIPPGAERHVQRVLGDHGVDLARPWIVLHPGATAPSRRYAPEGFAAVARALVRDAGYQVLITGSADEQPLIARIQAEAGAPAVGLAGYFDLGQLAALLARTRLLIANNTGPVHVAAALGTPVVDLYALTNPQHTPWGVPHRVLNHDVPCKYCYKSVCPEGHHNCLRLVTPQAVVAAARGLLAETADRPGATPPGDVRIGAHDPAPVAAIGA